jgi:hypothetical protein
MGGFFEPCYPKEYNFYYPIDTLPHKNAFVPPLIPTARLIPKKYRSPEKMHKYY